MRNLLIPFAAAASALAVATPASTQYYPAPQPQGPAYGYHGNYGGYHDNYGQVRRLQVRIDAIQRQIRQLDRRNVITNREAARLREDSRNLERRLRVASRNGLHPRERYQVERGLARLEARLWRDARDGNRWGRNRHDQHAYRDRDRDGRNDRREDDRGRDRDDRWDD